MNPSPEYLPRLAGQSFSQTLLAGEAGTAQTIRLARSLVDRAVKDPYVNRVAVEIVRGTRQYDDLSKIHAIYNWVAENFTYVQDPIGPFGAKETLRPVRDLLELRAGDCDDINCTLFPALLGTIGYSTRVVTIAGDPANPREFSHVYCEVFHDGEWIPMDAARPGARFGEAPPYYYRKKVWPMTDEGFALMGRGLNGYVGRAGMGDVAQDIQAAGSAAAQVISAANQNPYSYQYFSNSPLAATAAPGLMADQLGYGRSYAASATFSSNLTPWLIGGALLAVLLLARGK